jgi:hypothetical protein
MNIKTKAVIIILLFIILADPLTGLSQAAEPLTLANAKEFLREAWTQIHNNSEIDQEYHYTTKVSGSSGRQPIDRKGIVKRIDGCVLIKVYDDNAPVVAGRNAHYEFALVSTKEKPNGWTLGPFTEISSPEQKKHEGKYFGFGSYQSIYPLSTIASRHFDSLTKTIPIKFTKIQPLPGTLLRLEATIDERPNEQPNDALPQYIFIVDSSRGYCVVDYQMIVNGNMLEQSKRDIDQLNGHLICRKVTYQLFNPPNNLATDLVTEFSDHQFPGTGVVRECYLSHYGLPEPPGVTPPAPRSSWPWILGGAAMFFFLLAILLRYFSHKWAAKK